MTVDFIIQRTRKIVKIYKKIGRIKQFGDLWIITANNLIHNEKRSYRSVARQLDVDTKTVKKYANSSMNEKKNMVLLMTLFFRIRNLSGFI